jgi:hypothetical protein
MPERSYSYLAMAYYRIKRANSHFNELKRRAIELCGQIRQQQISFSLNAETNELSLNEPETTFAVEVPALLGVLVGEAVYNLRAALDYLVFDLALFRTGREQHGTQFPIESSDNGWRRHVEDLAYLAGLIPDDIAAVKRCQPCGTLNADWRKFQWLARFRDISNADKHRQWTVVAAMVKGSVSWKPAEVGSIGTVERGQIYRTVFSDGREMDVHVYGDFGPDVTLDDETPVVETLDEFIVKIKEVLDSFRPRFGGLAASMVVEVHDEPPQTAPAAPPTP